MNPRAGPDPGGCSSRCTSLGAPPRVGGSRETSRGVRRAGAAPGSPGGHERGRSSRLGAGGEGAPGPPAPDGVAAGRAGSVPSGGMSSRASQTTLCPAARGSQPHLSPSPPKSCSQPPPPPPQALPAHGSRTPPPGPERPRRHQRARLHLHPLAQGPGRRPGAIYGRGGAGGCSRSHPGDRPHPGNRHLPGGPGGLTPAPPGPAGCPGVPVPRGTGAAGDTAAGERGSAAVPRKPRGGPRRAVPDPIAGCPWESRQIQQIPPSLRETLPRAAPQGPRKIPPRKAGC